MTTTIPLSFVKLKLMNDVAKLKQRICLKVIRLPGDTNV